tara:strand:- start:142 stop:345 length:204 start_codon:yes stop_codon:yes gene_type:complete
MFNLIFFILFFFLFLTSKSFAYLDPGTGSIILHAILAFFAGCITWIVAKYRQIKSFISKLKKNKKQI